MQRNVNAVVALDRFNASAKGSKKVGICKQLLLEAVYVSDQFLGGNRQQTPVTVGDYYRSDPVAAYQTMFACQSKPQLIVFVNIQCRIEKIRPRHIRP